MKPAAFNYVAPRSVEETLGLLAEYGDDAKVLAGGQSLGPMMNLRVVSPSVVIDVNRVVGLGDYQLGPKGCAVGALCRQGELEDEPTLSHHQPLVAAALPHIAHRPIRNRGTVGGSLVHADPAAEWGALVLALDATMVIEKANQQPREVAAGNFFAGILTSAVEDDELLTQIRLPSWSSKVRFGFAEFARRHGDFALAGVAVRITARDDGRCEEARVAVFGVGDNPLRVTAAETLVEGNPMERALADQAGAIVSNEVDAASDNHASGSYRRRLLRVLVADALMQCADPRRAGAPAPAEVNWLETDR